MEFLQKNARAIIIALLAIGVVVAISAAGSSDDSDQAQEDSIGVVDEDGNVTGLDGAEEGAAQPAEEGGEQAEESVTPEAEAAPPREVQSADNAYTISAADGDNQTVLVREVISSYLADKDFNLNASQMLYAETNLVNELPRNDVILVGDTVRLDAATVESIVNQARELSQARQDAWAAYL